MRVMRAGLANDEKNCVNYFGFHYVKYCLINYKHIDKFYNVQIKINLR